MKSGSGDDPFAESSENDTPSESVSAEPDPISSSDTPTRSESAASGQTIPYKFRRDSVKADRNQRPIFLRPDVENREMEFIRTLEDELGEDVYKTDALEAAVIVAMNNPDLVADELRDWGYDWD